MTFIQNLNLNILDILELQGHHLQWNETLNEMINTLILFEMRLVDIAKLQNALPIKKRIEQFQNRFFIQRHEIYQLKNAIKKHELSISRKKEVDEESIDSSDQRYHNRIALRIKAQEIIFYKLKVEYSKFARKFD